MEHLKGGELHPFSLPEVSKEEVEEQIRLFEEIGSISMSVNILDGIVQNRGHYYSDQLDDYEKSINRAIRRLQQYKEDVRTFHKNYDSKYKEVHNDRY